MPLRISQPCLTPSSVWSRVRNERLRLSANSEDRSSLSQQKLRNAQWVSIYHNMGFSWVFHKWGYPIAGWFIRENPSINGWWLGVPAWLRKPPYTWIKKKTPAKHLRCHWNSSLKNCFSGDRSLKATGCVVFTCIDKQKVTLCLSKLRVCQFLFAWTGSCLHSSPTTHSDLPA